MQHREALKALQQAIDACGSHKTLRIRQADAERLAAASEAVVAASDLLSSGVELEAISLALVAMEQGGTVPAKAVGLLAWLADLLNQTGSSAAAPSAHEQQQQQQQAALTAVNALLGVLESHIVLLENLTPGATHDASLCSLAAAQPCAPLAACLRLQSTQMGPAAPITITRLHVVATAATITATLIELAAGSPAFFSSITAQLHATDLVALTCQALAQTAEPDPDSLVSLFAAYTYAPYQATKASPAASHGPPATASADTSPGNSNGSSSSGGRSHSGSGSDSDNSSTSTNSSSSTISRETGSSGRDTGSTRRCRPARSVRAALSAQPAFAALLLRGATHQLADEPCDFMSALSTWLRRHGHQDVAAQRALLRVTADGVSAAVDAIHRSADTPSAHSAGLSSLHRLLDPPAERQRAFPSLVTHLGRAQGPGPVLDRPPRALCNASALLLEQLLEQGGGTVKEVQSRARFVLRKGLLAQCEAAIRTHLSADPLHEMQGCTQLGCAMEVAVLLLDDGGGRDGAAALAACMAMLATHRKACARRMAAAAAAVAASAARTVACTARAAVHAAAPPDVPCLQDAPSRRAARIPDSCLYILTCAIDHMFRHTMLGAAMRARCPAARLLGTCASMQLLPLWVKQAGRELRLHPPGPSFARADFAMRLASAHESSCANVTAAAGAPRVLRRLLLEVHSGGGRPLDAAYRLRFVAAAAAALHSARDSALRAGEAAPPLAGAAPQEAAFFALPGTCKSRQAVDELLRWVAAELLKVERACTNEILEELRAPTLDVCRLTAVWRPPNRAGCVPPFFGCWDLGCINLAGGSEAGLKLKKCAGCCLSRYCSAACQRRAWRSGHRGLCQEWQRRHAAQNVLLQAQQQV